MHEKDIIKKWCIRGFYIIVLLGTFFHFFYDWSNHSKLFAAFFPVNESVWEHLKLGHWAVITFSIVEYFTIYKKVNNFFLAKAIGSYIISLTILLIFYSYYTFIGKNIVIVDILSYIIGVAICQFISYKIYQLKNSKNLNYIGITVLIITSVLLIYFTFSPPKLDIFKDKRDNSFGINITD